jgi:uncharacterized membrane protein YGL010W
MKSIYTWLDEYSQSHRNPTNKRIHWICVPVILFTVFGALRAVPGEGSAINAMTISMALTLAYYAVLSWRLALGMVPVFIVIGLISEASFRAFGAVPHLALMAAIFVAAWTGQFYGHKVEGKKPSFFKDIQFLMIGPLWLLADVFRRTGTPISSGSAVAG